MPERRKQDQRRWAHDADFPLKDSSGSTVIRNRRRMPDRRLSNTTLEDRLIVFAEMPRLNIECENGR